MNLYTDLKKKKKIHTNPILIFQHKIKFKSHLKLSLNVARLDGGGLIAITPKKTPIINFNWILRLKLITGVEMVYAEKSSGFLHSWGRKLLRQS